MSSLNVSQATKREFDALQPDNDSQDEFVQKLIAAHKRDDGQVVDPEAIAREVEHKVATKCETAAYRGIKDALGEL